MLTSLVLASALTLAADNSKMRSIEAQLDVDKSGKVQQLDWLHPEQVSDAVGAFLEPAVLAVEFEPAQKNGEATHTKLWLNVIVETVERADGGSDLRFVTVEKAWPRIVHTAVARYPSQMLMSGTSAYVMLSVEIDADGRPIEESIALAGDTSPKDSAKVRQFFSSAKKALSKAHFDHLEDVGGVKIGGRFNVPFVFCMNSCDAINAEVAKLRDAQVLVPSPRSDVKFASIKQNTTPKAAAGS